MIQEFKVLMYLGDYVDASLLDKGIYSCRVPRLYEKQETIERLIENALAMKDMAGNNFISENYINNLKKCKLVDVELTILSS